MWFQMSGKTNYEKFIFSVCMQKDILIEKEHPLTVWGLLLITFVM